MTTKWSTSTLEQVLRDFSSPLFSLDHVCNVLRDWFQTLRPRKSTKSSRSSSTRDFTANSTALTIKALASTPRLRARPTPRQTIRAWSSAMMTSRKSSKRRLKTAKPAQMSHPKPRRLPRSQWTTSWSSRRWYLSNRAHRTLKRTLYSNNSGQKKTRYKSDLGIQNYRAHQVAPLLILLLLKSIQE